MRHNSPPPAGGPSARNSEKTYDAQQRDQQRAQQSPPQIPIEAELVDAFDADDIHLREPSSVPVSLESTAETDPAQPPIVAMAAVEPEVAIPTAAEIIHAAAINSPADAGPPPQDRPESIPFRLVHRFGSLVEWPFGVASMIVGLAVLAAIPILHLVSLGYLLEVSGRVARSGRIRNGFIGVRKAARAGSVVVGAWLCLLPVQIISAIWYQANLIAPDSDVTARWRTAQGIVTVVLVAHIVAACYCGGRLRHFFWPLLAPFSLGMWLLRWMVSNRLFRPLIEQTLGRAAPHLVRDICGWRPLSDWFLPAVLISGLVRGTLYRNARDGLWDFVNGMRLPYFFWLGLRGLVGAVTWLALPCLLLIGGVTLPAGEGGGICLLVGIPSMIVVVMYLPFLQAHFAAENRLGAYLELGRVRRGYRHAPLAFVIAFVITVVFALPPFLFKIAPLSNLGATENELTWITCLVFIGFIFPAKLLTGWAVGRGRKRDQPAPWALQWLLRPVLLAPPVAYVIVLFFTQYVSWHGTWSLLEQHIFLMPAPFFGGS